MGFQSENRQTLFFSATFPPEICDLAGRFCKPTALMIKNKNSDLNQRIEQEIVEVPVNDRKEFLIEFLKKREFPFRFSSLLIPFVQ